MEARVQEGHMFDPSGVNLSPQRGQRMVVLCYDGSLGSTYIIKEL